MIDFDDNFAGISNGKDSPINPYILPKLVVINVLHVIKSMSICSYSLDLVSSCRIIGSGVLE